MSFFIRPGRSGSNSKAKTAGTKRKKLVKNRNPALIVDDDNDPKHKKSRPSADMDEEIESGSDSDLEGRTLKDVQHEDLETAQEKRLRLAKQYLEEVERKEREKAECDLIDHDVLSHRLKEDLLEQTGRLQKKVADTCKVQLTATRLLRGHKLSPTCLVLSPDDKHIYSGSKDGAIIKWCYETGKRLAIISGLRNDDKSGQSGHKGQVFCLAISSDNKFLVSGGTDKLIRVWNPETMKQIHKFTGHRDTISGLAFQKGTHQMFSCSHDHFVKVWNLVEMVYVETLFGHDDAVMGVDSLIRERAVTCGGRDNSVRIWKIAEESQLIFTRPTGSVDNVRLVNEEHFVSSDDQGRISVWHVGRKKPLRIINEAHGIDPTNGLPNWVSSLGVLQFSDLAASGSQDGKIHLWKFHEKFTNITPLDIIPVCGFVNAIQFSSDGRFLVAAIGQEHRLGRWWRIKEARNSLLIVPLTGDQVGETESKIVKAESESTATDGIASSEPTTSQPSTTIALSLPTTPLTNGNTNAKPITSQPSTTTHTKASA